jgi:hypothetical protein
LATFAAIFDSATKFHAALVFLLTTGSDGAVAFFVGLGHFESPKAMTGVSR